MPPRKALQPICANAVPSQRAGQQPRSVAKPLRFLEDDAVVLAAVFSDESPASSGLVATQQAMVKLPRSERMADLAGFLATSDNAVEALTAAKSERDAVAKERDALALQLAKATQDRAPAQARAQDHLDQIAFLQLLLDSALSISSTLQDSLATSLSQNNSLATCNLALAQQLAAKGGGPQRGLLCPHALGKENLAPINTDADLARHLDGDGSVEDAGFLDQC